VTAHPCSTSTAGSCDDAEPSPRSQRCVEDPDRVHCSRVCAWSCDACSEVMAAESDTDPVDHPDHLQEVVWMVDEQAESLVQGELLSVFLLDRSAALFVQDLIGRAQRHLAQLNVAVTTRLIVLDQS
jgi:hypothetical protein